MYVFFERDDFAEDAAQLNEKNFLEQFQERLRDEADKREKEEKKKDRDFIEDILNNFQSGDEEEVRYEGQYANYVISGDTISSTVFSNRSLDNKDDKNLNGSLEMMRMAKLLDDDGAIYLSGYEDEEQRSIMAYAAEKAGVKIIGGEDIKLDAETRKRMDEAWTNMQSTLPATQQQMGLEAGQKKGLSLTIGADQ